MGREVASFAFIPRERDLNEREREERRLANDFPLRGRTLVDFVLVRQGGTNVEVVSNLLRRRRSEREALFVKCRVAVQDAIPKLQRKFRVPRED